MPDDNVLTLKQLEPALAGIVLGTDAQAIIARDAIRASHEALRAQLAEATQRADAADRQVQHYRRELVGWLKIARVWAENWPDTKAREMIDKALAAGLEVT